MTPQTRRKIARVLHWMGIVGNFILAAATVFSAYGGMINPDTTAIGAIAAMMFPFFLALTAIVTVIDLIWFRKQAVLNCLSIIACIGPILTLCPLNFFRPSLADIEESGLPTLKVMTFNTLNFETFVDPDADNPDAASGNPTLDFILSQNADIVLCQEAEDIDIDEKHGFTPEQRDLMRERYPYSDVTSRGMAILSKYPFEKVKVPVADPNQLDLLRYDVSINDQRLHLFSVHMQSIGLTSDDKRMYRHLTEGDAPAGVRTVSSALLSKLAIAFRLRAAQARDVRDALNQVDGMVLLCGDFNDIPGSYAARVIESDDMTDAYRHAGLGPAITYHGDRFFFRIDHMFYRGPIEALRVWRGECNSSDHYPLIGIYELK